MISRVSFNGNVFLTGNTQNLADNHKNEIDSLRKYSDDNDCDVVVLSRGYYSDGTGQYRTIVVKKDNATGGNKLYKKVFDFMRPKKFTKNLVPFNYDVTDTINSKFSF